MAAHIVVGGFIRLELAARRVEYVRAKTLADSAIPVYRQ
jgi:hypothetical protein